MATWVKVSDGFVNLDAVEFVEIKSDSKYTKLHYPDKGVRSYADEDADAIKDTLESIAVNGKRRKQM